MNDQVVFMISGSAGTGKSAMAARFQSIGEVVDLDHLATCLEKKWLVIPELFQLALDRGCRVFAGVCDNWEDLLGVIKRSRMQPVVFVLTPVESQGNNFMKREEQKHRAGWNRKVWLGAAVEHVARTREICRREQIACFQLQRTSDGTPPPEEKPGRTLFVYKHSFFTVPKPYRFGWIPEGRDTVGFVGEFMKFIRDHWTLIRQVNRDVPIDTPIDLWSQVRGYRAFEKRSIAARKKFDDAETFNARGGVPINT